MTNPLYITFLVALYGVTTIAHYRPQVPKDPIRRENIERVLRTLTSDRMMGRPASDPAQIEPAAQFLENEFKAIGLKPIPGEQEFRQRFSRQRLKPGETKAILDGKTVPDQDVLVISDRTNFSNASPLPVLRIKDDTAVIDKRRLLAGRLRSISRDTSAYLVLLDDVFRPALEVFRQAYRNRILSGQPSGTRILILGAFTGERQEIRFTQRLENIPMANIAGMIPGKRSSEFVLFSSHYDHIGILKPVAGDSIANGADDDASGTTAVVELARHYMKQRQPERTIIFVAFTAEEIGGYGSKYFSSRINPDQVVAMFNIEMIGKPSKFGKPNAWITGFEKSDLGTIMQRNLEGSRYRIHPDPYPEQDLFYRSDNATLARLGVPAHSISTDQIDTDKLYHSVDDEFESIDLENLEAAIRAIAIGSRSVVDGKDTPRRINRAEVRN